MKQTLHFVRVQFTEVCVKNLKGDSADAHNVTVTFAENTIPRVNKDWDEDDESSERFPLSNSITYYASLTEDGYVKGGLKEFCAILGRTTQLMELSSDLKGKSDHDHGFTDREFTHALTGSEWDADFNLVEAGQDVTFDDSVYTYDHDAVRKDVLSIVLDADMEEAIEDYVFTLASSRCDFDHEKQARKDLRNAAKEAADRAKKAIADAAAK